MVNEAGVRLGGEKFAGYWRGDRGFADEIEIIVINDATACMTALQSGQVHMIRAIEPKVIELIKRIPGITIRNVAARATTLSTCTAAQRRSTTTICGLR